MVAAMVYKLKIFEGAVEKSGKQGSFTLPPTQYLEGDIHLPQFTIHLHNSSPSIR